MSIDSIFSEGSGLSTIKEVYSNSKLFISGEKEFYVEIVSVLDSDIKLG